MLYSCLFFFFFKQKTAYEMRISDWSSDVCSSDLKRWHFGTWPAAEGLRDNRGCRAGGIAEPRGSVGRSGLPPPCTPVRGWLSGLHASVQRHDDGQHGRSVNEQDASESLHRRWLSSFTEKPSSRGLHAEAIESAVLV